jgi:serine protease Do
MNHKLPIILTAFKRLFRWQPRNFSYLIWSFLRNHGQRIGTITSIAVGVLAISIALPPFNQYRATNPENDGYVQPRSVFNLVEKTQRSTVTIYCEYGKKLYSQGSGWSMKLRTSQKNMYPTAVITNHHVIEDCLNGQGRVSIVNSKGNEYKAIIDNWDKANDLAVLATKAKIPPLKLSKNAPWPGYWVMAVGTADGYAGSIAFGNVLNVTDLEVLITANISHGNSGGPLVDNEGFVIGTNTWGAKGEQYNGAKALDSMCKKLIVCKGEYFWARQE